MATPDTCKEIELSLDAYHDGELTPAEAEQVARHLAGCTTCTDRLADIVRVVSSLKQLPRLEAPVDFAERLDLAAAKTNNVLLLRPRVLVLSGIAAAVALVLVLRVQVPPAHQPVPSVPVVASTATAGIHASAPVALPETRLPEHASPAHAMPGRPAQVRQPVTKAKIPPAANPVSPDTGAANQRDKTRSMTQPDASATDTADNTDGLAIAELADSPGNSFSDATDIATDEDGLYEIKL